MTKTKKPCRDPRYQRRLPAYTAIRNMPALAHWPRKPEPFRAEDSEVLRWITDQFTADRIIADLLAPSAALKEAQAILQGARSQGLVKFSRKTRQWWGVDYRPTEAAQSPEGIAQRTAGAEGVAGSLGAARGGPDHPRHEDSLCTPSLPISQATSIGCP